MSWCAGSDCLPIDAVYRNAWRKLDRLSISCRNVANVEAHITGTVWKIEVAVGDRVEEGDTVAILESMKMEMPVEAEDEGTVGDPRRGGPGGHEGDPLVVLE